jgi:hypothetical protein
MGSSEDLPKWVLDLVIGLDRYSHEHPKLFVEKGAGTYEAGGPCACHLLADVPPDVRAVARWIERYTREVPA